jgi:hypothetical protein
MTIPRTATFTLGGNRMEILMRSRKLSVLLVSILLPILLQPLGIEAQTDRHLLAEQLLRGDAEERSRALEAVRSLGPQNIGPELRVAVIVALERESRTRAERYHADGRGEAIGDLEDPEFIFRISQVVAELRDPKAIPALAGALGFGSGSAASRALVAFGERAVPAILAVVKSPDTPRYTVDGALIVLRFMVEGAGPQALSPGALREIAHAAKQRLTGPQYFTTLWWAIDLAVVLNEAGLRRLVESLASDQREVMARGISKPDLIRDTQRLAAMRLAGVPPEPRWR